MKKLIIIGALLLGVALQGLAQDVLTPGMTGMQTRNAINTAFSQTLGVVDTLNETIRIAGVQITANATEVNILDGALVNVTELNRLVGLPGNIVTLLGGKENSLGNPGTTGYVLSSTTAGVRSWIAPGSGGSMVYPAGSGIPFVVTGTSWGTTVTTVSATELGYIDGLNGTAASRQNINDSLDQALSGAVEVIAREDSTGHAVGNYVTHDALDDAIAGVSVSGGGSSLLGELQALGFAGAAIPIGASSVLTEYVDLVDGAAYYQAFYLPEAATITGIRFVQRAQGSYTADNYNGAALYSVSGTTFTRVTQTADAGTFWTGGAYTLVTKAFPTPYSAAAGVYYVGILYNSSAQTSAPSIYCWNIVSSVSQVFLTTRVTGAVETQATLPTSEVDGDLTANNKVVGVWLY